MSYFPNTFSIFFLHIVRRARVRKGRTDLVSHILPFPLKINMCSEIWEHFVLLKMMIHTFSTYNILALKIINAKFSFSVNK